ncbi:hypothetical protein IPJ63_03415 [Candidatus Nomurabacteria bacterium]|nr:MAG: hypothetical protein IPJ63_03415 [Candidatus Nomurabacteria bacterium]
MNIIVVFGGADFEEAAARLIAKKHGLVLATATVDGVPCHAGNAYKANGFVVDEGKESNEDIVIVFECSEKVAGNREIIMVCDHHNPGDPGFGFPPENFWRGSSIGQLCKYLNEEPTEELLMVAASDHCFPAAYAGKCPGINPEEFAKFRISQKVAFYATDVRNAHKSTPSELEEIIQMTMQKISKAPIIEPGLVDMRGQGFVEELPESAVRLGLAYISEIQDRDRNQVPTGNMKIVIGGCTDPEMVVSFMEWANALPNKVGNAYGDPIRGFAGIVVKP